MNRTELQHTQEQADQEVIAIVPAAGIGSRMGADCPKQYLPLQDGCILGCTLQLLLGHPAITQVIVALHPQDVFFAKLPQAHHPKLLTVTGGQARADSVLAALNHVTNTSAWALVHDAARPCLTHGDIDKLLAARTQYPQGAILATPVRDTMKRASVDGSIQETVSRDALWHALTPQLFPARLLQQHLTAAIAAGAVVTDEASAMEWAGIHPGLVPGRSDNIKVTHPDDLTLAALYLRHRHVQC
ncbi:2-C-methyl-D-erythritol 4-phosphate cytidylyltransferase [Shewanella sp. YIC-542]|uniref:2-C-methyl-D-erythritol 4-phosphate cytidylyltransferase n=1 Tax=Shewanella mytili TaxID=3377111 RepID=UPI00398F1B77